MRKLLRASLVCILILYIGNFTLSDTSRLSSTELTHGPILSTSSDCSEMYVFCRVVINKEGEKNPGAFQVAYRPINAKVWKYTKKHTTSVESDFTAIAKFPVGSNKKYQYRIVNPENKSPLSDIYTFISLPQKQGEFVFYHCSDSHGANNDWPVHLLEHYREGFKDLPVAVLYTGDIFEIGPVIMRSQLNGNELDFIRNKYKTLYRTPAIADLFSQIPLFLIWDDWDFFGDNSSGQHTASRGFAKIDRSIALRARREYIPNPASFESHDTAAFHVNIANNLILVSDSRSRKAAISVTEEKKCKNILDGSQKKEEAPCWGKKQLNYMKKVLSSQTKETYKNFLVSTQSFIDNLGRVFFPCDGNLMGVRDSLGIFHKDERNDLLRFLQENKIDLIVLSGDDHKPKISYRDFWYEPHNVKEDPVKAKDITIGIFEFKAGNGGSTTRAFDSNEFPPFWWAGCANEYTQKKPVKGYGNLTRKDVGFCFHIINDVKTRLCQVQAILLEDEVSLCKVGIPEGIELKKAPYVVYKDDFSHPTSQMRK